MAIADTLALTATRRAGENGSRKCPATPAVMAKPAIIIIHTMLAAAALRWGATCLARVTSSEVPAALAPRPMAVKAAVQTKKPHTGLEPISIVPAAAPTPPPARIDIPPTIQPVVRPPTSDP